MTHFSLSASIAATAGAIVLFVAAPCPPAARAAGTVSTVSPRAMGMGGAFLAVEDGLAAVSWNPAGLAVPLCRGGARIRVHANALGAVPILHETGILTGTETERFGGLAAAERAMILVGSIAKGTVLRRGSVCVGVLLLEESLDPETLDRSRVLADAGDLLDGYYSTAAVSFALAPSVSIGAAHTVFAGLELDGERVFGTGRAYGALLRPNERVAVGFVYFDAAPGFEGVRAGLEGFGPRTMNAGIAYRLSPRALVTVDVRDLSEKGADTALEPRAGAEWRVRRSAALRGGLFREREGGPAVLTLGVGALPMTGCRGAERAAGDACAVDYAVLLSSGRAPAHLLSVFLRF